MPALYSNPPLADVILSEARGQRSRDNVVVVQTGAAVASGTLLSKGTSGNAGKYVPYVPAGADPDTDPGTGKAVAVLYNALPAKTGDTKAVAFTSDCEVKASALTGSSSTSAADLLEVGIKVRASGDRLGVHTPAL